MQDANLDRVFRACGDRAERDRAAPTNAPTARNINRLVTDIVDPILT